MTPDQFIAKWRDATLVKPRMVIFRDGATRYS